MEQVRQKILMQMRQRADGGRRRGGGGGGDYRGGGGRRGRRIAYSRLCASLARQMAAAWAAACLAPCVSATDARAGDLASPPAHRGAFREVERQGVVNL